MNDITILRCCGIDAEHETRRVIQQHACISLAVTGRIDVRAMADQESP